MKKGRNILKRILSLMLCLVIASGMFAGMGMEAKAYEYSGSSESKSIKVMNYAGEYISGGKMNFEGYFYYNGHTEIINGNTINHAIYRTVQTNLNGNEYNVAIWFSYYNSTGSTQVYPSYNYWFEDFNSEYVMPDSGTFDARGTLEIKALRKNVLLNVSLLDANGNPVTSGVTVTMNGQSDSQAPYEFSGLKEGNNYDINVSGNGYDASMRYTVEKNGMKSRNTSMNIGSRNFLLRAAISLDGNIYDNWWDNWYTIKAGDITLDHEYNSDGYYFRKKLPAGTYELSVEGLKGVTVASQNIDLNSKDQTITLQATLKTPEITGGNVVKCGETLDLNIKEVVEYWKPTYIWRSSDPSVATIDENGIITGKKVGTTKVTVTCSYGNQSATSAEKTITVIKGQANHPTGAAFVDTDVVDEKKVILKVSDNANVLNTEDMAIVKVSGECIIGGSYTTETPIRISEDRTVTVDLSGKLTGEYLQGIVGAELTYSSENYDYEPTGVTDNAGTSTYYITMPLSVALNTNGTSIEQERLVYGDTRTLSIHTTDNIIAGNKIKYLFNVTEAPDVLSGIDSSNLSDKTTALDDIVVANAGTTKVLVTRPRIGAPYYWEAASDEIFVEVAKKEINPLTMVIYKNATERVYDGTNVIETIGTIVTDSADGKVKDSDDVSVSAQLFIEGKDVGTYTPANGNIKITNYALTGADARNYKLPDSIPTEKIKTIDTSLTIKERPVTVSGIKASDKLYDQNANAELNYNEVTISNIVDGEDLNVTATGLFLGKDVVRDSLSSAIAKTVEISEIKLMDGTLGKVSNYVLGPSGNQKTTTATIHPIKTKVLVTVNDKQYDGLNTATIKNSGLEGIIVGDTVILENGTPTFDNVGEADNEKTIGVSFTDFSIRGADAINYDLTQPTGVKANIYNNYKAEKKIDYDVNSNEWINKDFVVTANINYQLSETDDMTSGTWSATLSRSEDVTDGKLKFYIRDMESGAISKSVIETYNIDTILPTGEVELAENKWMVFWNGITFEKFFNKTQTVTITAYDERSGVASVEYYEADRELNLDELKALSTEDWTEGKKVNVTLEDAKKFVYYARITDKAGNVNYLNTNGSVYDITFPTLTGVEEGEVYYTTQTITVKDTNLATIKLNGEDVTSPVRLSGNVDKVYEVVAIDKAGNKATLSITMKPLSELSGDITDNNVSLSDEKELKKSEEILREALKEENLSKLTEEEEKAIREKLSVIQKLIQDIDEVQEVIKLLKNLPSAYVKDGTTVNPYVSDRMDDEEQKLYSAVKAAYKAYENLSSHQQSLISTSLKHNLSNLRKILTDYRIVDGNDKIWVYDTNGTLTFTANGPVVRFTAAFVDGKKVPADEMKVTKGSTVVELDAGYLYRLGLGDHIFQMEYEDGKTDVVEFSIVTMEEWNAMSNQQSGSNKTGGVATGDNADILLWGAALILGAAGLVVANKKRKNEKA